jgi:hypothetical protein
VKGIVDGSYCFSDDNYRYDIDWSEVWDDVKTVTAKEPVRELDGFHCGC